MFRFCKVLKPFELRGLKVSYGITQRTTKYLPGIEYAGKTQNYCFNVAESGIQFLTLAVLLRICCISDSWKALLCATFS